MVSVLVFLIYWFNFIECNCDKDGSQSQTCDGNWKCTCKYGYTGQTCSVCADGFYKKWNVNQSICSGIIALYLFGFIAVHIKFVIEMSDKRF